MNGDRAIVDVILGGDASRGQNRRGTDCEASVPWLFMVTHEQLEPGVDVAATLDSCGLVMLMPMTGMPLSRRPLPTERAYWRTLTAAAIGRGAARHARDHRGP